MHDWTLISVKEPEKNGFYLATTDNGNVELAYFKKYDNLPLSYWEKHIIAWMPLPEPYSKDKED